MKKKICLFSLMVVVPLAVCANGWSSPFAYITNWTSNDVYVIDTSTNTVVGSPIPVGAQPYGVAVNPSGTRVYVANANSDSVSVIDTSTNTVVGSPIPVGTQPYGVAVNPTGTWAYVTNYGSNDVYVIDTSTNTVVGSPIPVGTHPYGVAVNPAGTRVYVANIGSADVSVIDTATNTVVGSPIPVGTQPEGVAVNPAGTRVYVTNVVSSSVSVIDTETHTVIGSPIPVGTDPIGVAVNPSGTRVYVANYHGNSVSVIDTSTNTVVEPPIAVGTRPVGVAVNPMGTQVYVANIGSDNVSVIDAATNTVIGSPIPVGIKPQAFGQFIGPDLHEITVTPMSLEFGDSFPGASSDKVVTVRNDGGEDLILGTITSPSPPFFKTDDDCSDQTLPPDGSCEITIRFLPPSIGDFVGNFNIPSNDPDRSIVEVSLSGRGVEAPAITSASSAIFTVGSAGSFMVTSTGYPTPTITRGGASLPGGVTFVDNGNSTGTLSGTPAAGTGGTYNLTFTASNGVSPNVAQNFTLTVDTLSPITLTSPSDQTSFDACSFYSLPTFAWNPTDPFKSYEIQFSMSDAFSSISAKVKTSATEVQLSSSTWKKILLIPGVNGGSVYWKVIGTRADKTQATSNVCSLLIEAAHEVESPQISPTSKGSLPTLSWTNHCNMKFKVWFGNDSQFSKKKTFSFNLKTLSQTFTKDLTSSQWSSVRKLVGDTAGATIYWYIESWNGLKRNAKTDVLSFVLTD